MIDYGLLGCGYARLGIAGLRRIFVWHTDGMRYRQTETGEGPQRVEDRDRGTPRDATPPTPPGIRVTYQGGSTGLSLDRNMESGEADRVEIAVGQCLLDRRVS